MANYFIEVRIMGQMKHEIRSIIYDVRRKFHLRGSRPVPHIAIVYEPTPNNPRRDEKRLISDFIYTCSRYPAMEFQFDGFGSFPNEGVAKINIAAPRQMYELRWDLIRRLSRYCRLDPRFDTKQNDYNPHASIALNLRSDQFKRVMNYIYHMRPLNSHHYLARATLLKNGRILREYDFFLRRPLARMQALNPVIMARTRREIRQHINKRRQQNFVMRIFSLPTKLLRSILRGF